MSVRGEGRAYAAYPTLRGVRWLLPARLRAARRAGMREFFHPRSAKGRALKTLIVSGSLRGRRILLEEEPLSRLEERLTLLLGEAVRIGFYIGSPGAYRKATALVFDSNGETLAFAKIATSDRARADIEAERRNLLRLSGCQGLRGHVPEMLGHFRWNSHEILVMTGGPPQPGPERLSEPHLEFCRSVFEHFASERVFAESPMWKRMSGTLHLIGPKLPEEVSSLLGRALERLREGLGDVSLPLSMAHRDFAPWNTRLGPQGLFVYDWDRAEDGATPLYDVFHFRSIQAVLLGQRERAPDRRHLQSLLERTWPEGRRHLPQLYLAYLLDMSLFYGEARMAVPESGEAKVWHWFLSRIESFLDQAPRSRARTAFLGNRDDGMVVP